MKTATTLLRSAESLGITLWVDGDLLRYKARQPISDGFKDRLREHKAEIINLLSKEPDGSSTQQLPTFCRVDCPGLEAIDLPNEGEALGCIHPGTGAWRRLDLLAECPALAVNHARRPLPKWCNPSCSHLHSLTVPTVGQMRWCRHEQDERHWQRNRIDSMTGCPLKEATR